MKPDKLDRIIFSNGRIHLTSVEQRLKDGNIKLVILAKANVQ